ncbi:hypothetical protein KVV02_008408 [Mortierella alpina]|uniref:Uncharacterized protein n=1 Tax=Mortierella alpina TaxID=64518 RepID=A0A9P8AB75_MORAP|nr:hypothetical protein KVV02_008408 [Mortierella alpina]
MKPATILRLGHAVALLLTATCQALEFTIPENIAIGHEVTVEWAGTPSLDTSDQSVVLFKDDDAVVSLCQGLVSGSGKCTFTLAEGDVKTQERGSSGYHIGLQGEGDITLDISKDFSIRSAKDSSKPGHRKEEHEERHRPDKEPKISSQLEDEHGERHHPDKEPKNSSPLEDEHVHHHHRHHHHYHHHGDREASPSSEYETPISTYDSTSKTTVATNNTASAAEASATPFDTSSHQSTQATSAENPSSSSPELSPTSQSESQEPVVPTSLTSTSNSATTASSSPEPAEPISDMGLDDSQKKNDMDEQTAKTLAREKKEEEEEKERKQRNPEVDVEDTWAQVVSGISAFAKNVRLAFHDGAAKIKQVMFATPQQ